MSPLQKLKQWATPKRLFLWLVVYPGIPPVVATIGLITFANWPSDISSVALPGIKDTTKHVTIIAHGKDDTAKTWASDMAKAFAEKPNSDNSEAFAIDWSDYSNNIFRCSLNGKRIGERLGGRLAEFDNVESVHVIGHSAGAFLTYGLCESLKALKPSINVQTTYLDPLGPYGVMFWNYGPDNFGRCADSSDAYINVGDGVPGSDVVIENAQTFDVTQARISSSFKGNPHVWPIHYYLDLVQNGKL